MLESNNTQNKMGTLIEKENLIPTDNDNFSHAPLLRKKNRRMSSGKWQAFKQYAWNFFINAYFTTLLVLASAATFIMLAVKLIALLQQTKNLMLSMQMLTQFGLVANFVLLFGSFLLIGLMGYAFSKGLTERGGYSFSKKNQGKQDDAFLLHENISTTNTHPDVLVLNNNDDNLLSTQNNANLQTAISKYFISSTPSWLKNLPSKFKSKNREESLQKTINTHSSVGKDYTIDFDIDDNDKNKDFNGNINENNRLDTHEPKCINMRPIWHYINSQHFSETNPIQIQHVQSIFDALSKTLQVTWDNGKMQSAENLPFLTSPNKQQAVFLCDVCLNLLRKNENNENADGNAKSISQWEQIHDVVKGREVLENPPIYIHNDTDDNDNDTDDNDIDDIDDSDINKKNTGNNT